MTYTIPESRDEAGTLDEHDILAHAREAFDIPAGTIYLVGHSLGPATHTALDALLRAGSVEWREGLVSAWNTAGWFDLPLHVGNQIARLIGADEGEVIIADSVSVNLYKLAAAARSLARSSTLIVEEGEFPTDQYILEALAGLADEDFIRAERGQGLDRLAETGGVLVLSAVDYRSAEVRDIAAHESRAADAGGVIIWDLSHATGVLQLDLNTAGARLAAGCTYKYLNGGPGAPAFLYVHESLMDSLETPLPGWMGHARPFAFEPSYTPAPGIRRMASGTPPILSLSALSGALEVFEALDPGLIENKARALGDLVIARTQAIGLEVMSPLETSRRGGHVSFIHPNGYEVVQALIARGILADFRAPDTIRFGVSPLYLGFEDVWTAMDGLEDILETRSWDNDAFRKRAKVT